MTTYIIDKEKTLLDLNFTGQLNIGDICINKYEEKSWLAKKTMGGDKTKLTFFHPFISDENKFVLKRSDTYIYNFTNPSEIKIGDICTNECVINRTKHKEFKHYFAEANELGLVEVKVPNNRYILGNIIGDEGKSKVISINEKDKKIISVKKAGLFRGIYEYTYYLGENIENPLTLQHLGGIERHDMEQILKRGIAIAETKESFTIARKDGLFGIITTKYFPKNEREPDSVGHPRGSKDFKKYREIMEWSCLPRVVQLLTL